MNKTFKSLLKKIFLDLYWGPQIPFLSNPLPLVFPKSILFVCKGNICRSPFAEHLAIKQAFRYNLGQMMIASAGLHAPMPLPPPMESIEIARTFGMDLSQHRSQNLNESLVGSADVIIVMEPSHLKKVYQVYPMARNKIWLLTAFNQEKKFSGNWRLPHHIIPDPFGGSLAEFNECFKRIEICINQLFSLYIKP